MTISEIREICLTFPGVTEDIKWGDHLCFNIGSKMFLITNPDSVPVTASFKTTDDEFETLTNREGFIPAPYLARNKWVYVDNINRLSRKEWIQFLQLAYDLVVAKLPLKFKKQLSQSKKSISSSKLLVKRTIKRVQRKSESM